MIARNDLKYALEDFLKNIFEDRLKIHAAKFNNVSDLITDIPFYKDNLFDQINTATKENLLGKTLIQEMSIAKQADILAGETSEERFLSFIELTNNPEWLKYFKLKYKFLIKKLCIYIHATIDYSLEILSNFKKDYNNISNKFDIPDGIKICFINLSKSDLHNNNKSVAFLHLEINKNIIYKPKDLSLEVWFSEFINWISDAFKYPIKRKFPIIYCREDYGWVEEIIHEIGTDEGDILSYYFALGQYMAIFHGLGSYDIINDNVICVRHTPVFIDLETLLFKKRRKKYNDKESILFESVSKLGILPNANNIGLQGTHDFDGAMIKRPENYTLKFWANKGQDNMHQILKDFHVSKNDFSHLPFNPTKYSFQSSCKESFISGFENFYQKVFIDRKDLLLNNLLFNKLNGLKIRVLMRDTANYSKLADESTHPTILKTQKSFYHQLNVLKELPERKYLPKKIIKEEIDQLKSFNIPYFYSYIGSTSLYFNSRIVIKNYFDGQDLNQIKENFKNKSKKKLALQKSLITQKLDFYLDHEGQNKTARQEIFHFIKNSSVQLGSTELKKDDLLRSAEKIGNLIIERSLIINNSVDFIFKSSSGIENVYNINLSQYELYQGKTGIALFMLYLYKYNNNDKFLKCAKNLFLSYIQTIKKDLLQNSNKHANISLSPYFYPLDALYLSCHFTHILNDSSYYAEVYSLLKPTLDLTINSNINDFLTGRSGVLYFLLELLPLNPSLATLIHQIKDKILSEKQQMRGNEIAWKSSNIKSSSNNSDVYLGGFSHGVSGIATSLAKYYKTFNNHPLESRGIIDVIGNALAYEDSLYNPTSFRWKDLRYGLDDTILSAHWCHGSAGIILARLLVYDYLGDELPGKLKINNESLIAIGKDIFNNSLNRNYGICHGDMGNLEILNLLNSHLDNKGNTNEINSMVNRYAERILCNTNEENFPSYEPLGLFNGISGIGYTLLRFYNWEETPSLLCLETPMFKNETLH